MTPKSSSQTRQIGLRLTLGGAPDELHTVAGLSGFYRPSRPTPVGGPGEPTVEQAEAAVKAGAHLEVVELKDEEVDELRALAAHDHERARGNTTEQEPPPEAPALSAVEAPGAYTVEDVLSAFADATPEDVATAQALEAEGKNRKTIVDYEPPAAAGQEG